MDTQRPGRAGSQNLHPHWRHPRVGQELLLWWGYFGQVHRLGILRQSELLWSQYPSIQAIQRRSAAGIAPPSREVPEHSEGRQLVDPLGRIFVTLWRFVFGCRVWSSKLHESTVAALVDNCAGYTIVRADPQSMGTQKLPHDKTLFKTWFLHSPLTIHHGPSILRFETYWWTSDQCIKNVWLMW